VHNLKTTITVAIKFRMPREAVLSKHPPGEGGFHRESRGYGKKESISVRASAGVGGGAVCHLGLLRQAHLDHFTHCLCQNGIWENAPWQWNSIYGSKVDSAVIWGAPYVSPAQLQNFSKIGNSVAEKCHQNEIEKMPLVA